TATAYAELRLKPRPNGSSRSETSASESGIHKGSVNFMALVLGFLLLVLLGAIAVLARQRTTCQLCPPGWQLHRGRCYYFSEEAVSWDDSQRNCLARKSQLLVIEDEIEMEFIDNKEKDTKYIWIGLKIQDMEKQWSSAEGPGANENR
ncbi:PREDICTED: killer cell lectin-like receptor subfamily F member 1, partial [Tauraco erythrolophus]|uniref:killer cell lectin-like receptor subfamily F member 1 n=1 Tax=Tauraco erythrolophus TaxID=121530 RepID=UPI000523AB4E